LVVALSEGLHTTMSDEKKVLIFSSQVEKYQNFFKKSRSDEMEGQSQFNACTKV